jgi:hypothetical protein
MLSLVLKCFVIKTGNSVERVARFLFDNPPLGRFDITPLGRFDITPLGRFETFQAVLYRRIYTKKAKSALSNVFLGAKKQFILIFVLLKDSF